MITYLTSQSRPFDLRYPFISFNPVISGDKSKVTFGGSFMKINEGLGIYEVTRQTFNLEAEFYLNIEVAPLGSIQTIRVVPLSEYDDYQELDSALNIMIPLAKFEDKELVFLAFNYPVNFYRGIPSAVSGYHDPNEGTALDLVKEIPIFKDKKGFHVFFIEKNYRGLDGEVLSREFKLHSEEGDDDMPAIKMEYDGATPIEGYTYTLSSSEDGLVTYDTETKDLLRPIGILRENKVLPLLNYSPIARKVTIPKIYMTITQRRAFFMEIYWEEADFPAGWDTLDQGKPTIENLV